MHLIFCVDEKKGLLFNKRRQSQDRVVREHILALSEKSRLWMSQYSAKQFLEGGNFIVDDDYASKAGPNDYCFVEAQVFTPEGCEKIVLYHWNRRYPADTYFDLDLQALGYCMVSRTEFAGHSHEKITEEIYVKKEQPS